MSQGRVLRCYLVIQAKYLREFNSTIITLSYFMTTKNEVKSSFEQSLIKAMKEDYNETKTFENLNTVYSVHFQSLFQSLLTDSYKKITDRFI